MNQVSPKVRVSAQRRLRRRWLDASVRWCVQTMSTAVSPCLFLAKHMSDGEINKVGVGWRLAGWLLGCLAVVTVGLVAVRCGVFGWVQFVFSLPQVSLFMQKVIVYRSMHPSLALSVEPATVPEDVPKPRSVVQSKAALSQPAKSPWLQRVSAMLSWKPAIAVK